MSFKPREKVVLFFSRGKGRGHAVPDAAIARELISTNPELKFVFASYSTGAATLRGMGFEVRDFQLPEDNPVWDTVIAASRTIETDQPSLVISHEEFCAVPVAKMYGVPCIFLTDWLVDSNSWHIQALKYADSIILMDEPGYYDVPDYLKHKITYVGTVVRELDLQSADGQVRKNELDIPKSARVVLVCPGGAEFHTEARAPLFDLVVKAFAALPFRDKRLIWVTGTPDHDTLQKRIAGRHNIRVIAPHEDFISTLLMADLVITKGSRKTLFECEAMGIATISISFGINPIDDYRIIRISTNTALRANGLDADILRRYMVSALKSGEHQRPLATIDIRKGLMAVVGILQDHIRRATALSPPISSTRPSSLLPSGMKRNDRSP